MKKNHLLLILVTLTFAIVIGTGGCSRAKRVYNLERANRLFDSGQFDEAEIEYLNALRVDPRNAQALGRLGIIYFDEGRFQKAAPFLFNGSELVPTNLELRVKLARIYQAIGELKKAREQCEFVLKNDPHDAEAPIILSQSAVTQTEITAAQKELNALAHNRDDAALETALGVIASRERDFRTALVNFQRALGLDSKFAAAYAALGDTYWQLNQPEKARAAFKAAADCAPSYSPLKMELGQFEIQSANFAAAESCFSDLTQKTPDYIPAWLGLAEVALDEKKFDDSSTALDKALTRDTENVSALLLRARLNMACSNTTKAIAELEGLEKLYPGAPGVHYQLALAYIINGQTTKALNQSHEAVGLDPNFANASFLLAQLELKTGNIESAVALLKQLVAQQPDLIPTKLLLAGAYRLQNDFNDAQEIYQQLEKLFPKDPQFSLLAGSTYVQQLNDDAARQEFNRVLSIDPGNVPAQEALVQLDLTEKQFGAAQERVERIISKDPQEAQPQILLAKIYLDQGQTNQAESALLKASNLKDGLNADEILAQLYFNLKQDQKALNILNPALAIDTNNPSLFMFVAAVQNDQGNYKAAADTYEKLLIINPQYSPALNNLACLYCDNLGDLDKAYALAQRARQLQPADPSTADTLGWVLFKKGQYSSALKLFQESANALPDNPEVQFHVGVAHYMVGDEDASRQALQNALGSNTAFVDHDKCQSYLSILNIDPATADAKAIAALEKRITEKPDDFIAFVRLAAIYQRDKNTPKCIALCEAVLKANSQNVKAMILLAQLCSSSDPQKAFGLAKAAYQLKPDDAMVRATLGHMAFLNGNDPWAYSLLEGASQDQPNSAQTLFDLANVAFCVGKVSEAQADMQNASQAGLAAPQSTKAQYFLNMVTLCQNPDQTITDQSSIDDILSADPNDPSALFAKALVDVQNNNPVGAERAYESLLDRHPNCTLAQKNLAILYAQNFVEPDKAYPVAVKAREAFPDDTQVAKALAMILFRQGDYTRAADLLNTISGSSSADAQLFYYLGISDYHLKNFMQSKSSLERALTLNLSGQEATDARETLAELH